MKVLIVGLGSIAKKHISALREIVPNVELYALRSSITAKPYEDVFDFYDWNAALNVKYDFIIISNPTANHRETISKLKNINTPLFIEKPLFDSLEGQYLVDELVSLQIPTYVACNLRFLQVVIYLRNNLLKNRVNEVNVYCGSYLPDWRPNIDFRKCYSANPNMGGGVHIDLIHEIDYVYWLFGKHINVKKTFSNKSSLNIEAYDYANYMLEYGYFNVNIVLNYYRRDSKRTCEIVTDVDTFTIDLLDGIIKNSNNDIIYESSQKIIDTYKPQMSYFLDMLNSGRCGFNTIEDGYNVLKICLA